MIRTEDRLVGRTADGERVYVGVRLERSDRPQETVDHVEVAEYDEFAASGLVVERYRRDATRAGQILDALLDVTRPQAPLAVADVRSLHAIWSEWHLNGTTAGCSHQTVIVYEESSHGPRIDLDGTTAANDCPVGYRYGSAWLLRPLPADVKAEIERIAALLVDCPTYEGS